MTGPKPRAYLPELGWTRGTYPPIPASLTHLLKRLRRTIHEIMNKGVHSAPSELALALQPSVDHEFSI